MVTLIDSEMDIAQEAHDKLYGTANVMLKAIQTKLYERWWYKSMDKMLHESKFRLAFCVLKAVVSVAWSVVASEFNFIIMLRKMKFLSKF